MAEVKIRLASALLGDDPEIWRIASGPGVKVYVSEEQLARWVRVLTEFDTVQQEMRDVLHEEYEL